MSAAVKINEKRKYTLEEFYELQDKIDTVGLVYEDEPIYRVEFLNGEIKFMARGSLAQGRVISNLFVEVGKKLEGSECVPYNEATGLAIDALNVTLHPDLMIVCGEMEISEVDKNALVNASILFEVLSPSTEGYDRGEKFHKYKQIPSFKEYILVNQDKPVIESFIKHDKNLWTINRFEGIENNFKIHTLNLEIPMSIVYKGIYSE